MKAPTAALLLLALPCSLTAQQAGLPVDQSPAHLPVFGMHLDFGLGAGYANTGRLRSIGARAHFAREDVQLLAGFHRVSPGHDALENGYGVQATIAWRLLRPRPRRVANIQAGLGWLRFDEEDGDGAITIVDVPLSFALGAYLPTPLGPAEAWVAPRAHVRHASGALSPTGEGVTRIGPGASAGFRFTLADQQAGASISVDGLALDDPAGGWRVLGSFQLGLHLLLLR